MSAYEDVLYEVKHKVAIVSLNRPDSLNAYTTAMGRSLESAVAAAIADDTVRVIVLTGAGRGFCAGADMKLLQQITPGTATAKQTADTRPELRSGLEADVAPHYSGRFGYLLRASKPVIAAVNGPIAGLGLVLALYADLRFAGSDAKFTTSFAQRGLIAEHGISWLLPRLIGPANALDLLLSARKFGAAEAERIGLVNKVFPQASFMDDVIAYARALADSVSPRSMAIMKAQVWMALCQDFNQSLDLADSEMRKSFASADFKEGVAHFVEKRAPAFSGA
ncbi:MAG: enoyl-CoA hydratase [Betaproteobacteria bacterium]|nr:enoyl-CoA hydratase [Betaproteobacteria bacterium]